MIRHLWPAAAVIALAFVCRPSCAASFDCAKAATKVESAICADPVLSKRDDDLQRVFHASRSTLAEQDVPQLVAEQKKWIAERDRTCGAVSSAADATDCLRKSYDGRIKAVSALRLNSPYGVLRYHIVGNENPDPVHLIAELFDQTLNRDGPLRGQIKCNNTDADKVCQGLAVPDVGNTVIIEYGSGGAATGFGARYRTLLTDEDGGSGHFTNPVAALDFEYVDDQVMTPDGDAVSDIKVSMTGMAPLPAKLPHLTGFPESSGCFGCP